MKLRFAIRVGLATVLWCAAAHAERTIDAALRSAAQSGNIVSIKRLLSEGADANKSDALLVAIERGQHEAVTYLLDHGADANDWIHGRNRLPNGAEGSPAFLASKLGDRQVLKALKLHKADLNAESMSAGESDDTPLIFAIRHDEVDAVKLLIEYGADVNHKTRSGRTALHEAILYPGPNSLALVRVLISHGADPDVKDQQGRSARDRSYSSGVAGIRESIEKSKPPPPFTRPEEVEQIRAILLCKSVSDEVIDGYEKRTRVPYARWRAPRASTISALEAASDFKKQRDEAVKLFRSTQSAQSEDETRNKGADDLRSQCEPILPKALGY